MLDKSKKSYSKNHRVVVVGDIILDKFIYGVQQRNSAEAAIPVFDVIHSEYNLGGAANVAANLCALGIDCKLLGVIGNNNSNILTDLFKNTNVNTSYIHKDTARITTVKNRFVVAEQQIFRADEEVDFPIEENITLKLIESLNQIHKDQPIDFLVLQDYNKGVLHKKNIPLFIDFALQNNIPIAVDPKFSGFLDYHSITLFKPNKNEFVEALNLDKNVSIEQIIKMAELFRIEKNIKHLVVTLSQQGLLSISDEGINYCRGIAVQNPDVCGAGDTLIAVGVWAMLQGQSAIQTATLMNKAGALICSKRGVVALSLQEVLGL